MLSLSSLNFLSIFFFTTYLLSQFADDTTIFLNGTEDIPKADHAIQNWCLATGMKENIKKREGLAMGKLQHTNLPTNVKWAPEGGWCISLGIPIGNNINQEKWWKKKIISVRHATKKWKARSLKINIFREKSDHTIDVLR